MKRQSLLLFVILAISMLCSTCKSEPEPNEPTLLTPSDTSETTEISNQPEVPGIDEDYDDTQRLVWQKPEVVIDLLGNVEDKTIADIGAGTGFFSLRLAQKAEKVIAIDIDPRFIQYLDSAKVWELPNMYQDRLEARLAKPNNPKLSDGEVDIAIIVNTYIYIPNRINYLRNLMDGLSENGKILIVDFKKKRTSVGPPPSIRIPLFQVEEELYKAGYSNVKTYDTVLSYQYILIAEKSAL